MKQKRGWLLLAAAFVVAALLLGLRACQGAAKPKDPVEQYGPASHADAPASAPASTQAPYQSPVDFAKLWQQNDEICAWLEIPGTEISYPVLLSKSSNAHYLDHAVDGSYSKSGSLFIEDYNQGDFSDPVSVIYGHHMRSGAFFGNLQSLYSDADSFAKLEDVNLYLPEKTIKYKVFAAVPFDDLHILYYNDFTSEKEYQSFFQRVYAVRSLNAVVNEALHPVYGQRVLILSTCLAGDNTRRYLVMAVENISDGE